MPSHVHAVIAFSNTDKTINSVISNGKRFIAYDLVNRLQQQNSHLVLIVLTDTSFDWKECRTEKFIQQKLIIYISIRVKEISWLSFLNNT